MNIPPVKEKTIYNRFHADPWMGYPIRKAFKNIIRNQNIATDFSNMFGDQNIYIQIDNSII